MGKGKMDGDWVAGNFEYVGLGMRVIAATIDSLILLAITGPPLHYIYGETYDPTSKLFYGGWDLVLSWILPLVATIWFWRRWQATPGKLLILAEIIDAESGGVPTMRQWVIRYLGYVVAVVPLGLGILWIGWDRRKQGWHDKMAGTVVVRPTPEDDGGRGQPEEG